MLNSFFKLHVNNCYLTIVFTCNRKERVDMDLISMRNVPLNLKPGVMDDVLKYQRIEVSRLGLCVFGEREQH